MLSCIATITRAAEPLQIRHRAPDSPNDKRQNYNIDLLQLTLDKTAATYGAYQLISIPQMNTARARSVLVNNYYPNLILELTYDDSLNTKKLDYIPFPVELGVLSYRVCFISPMFHNTYRYIRGLSDLENGRFAVGIGWPDTPIFRDNNFSVSEINGYDNIFKMLSVNRVNFFCRGANEVLNEYNSFHESYPFHYDQSFALKYSLPRFFFVHTNNQALKKRIAEGLAIAYKDGSLQALFDKHFSESITFAAIPKRKIFILKNKRIKNINKEYQNYLMSLEQQPTN